MACCNGKRAKERKSDPKKLWFKQIFTILAKYVLALTFFETGPPHPGLQLCGRQARRGDPDPGDPAGPQDREQPRLPQVRGPLPQAALPAVQAPPALVTRLLGLLCQVGHRDLRNYSFTEDFFKHYTGYGKREGISRQTS